MIDLLTPEQEARLRDELAFAMTTATPLTPAPQVIGRIFSTLDATRAENERLRQALAKVEPVIKGHSVHVHVNCSHCARVIHIARAALNSTGGQK